MLELVMATGNVHKKQEVERMIPDAGVLLPADLGIDFSVEETGVTYLENALLKARGLWSQVSGVGAGAGQAVLADDSGLSVRALSGRPGVYSARYGNERGGRNLEAWERNELLLDEMRGVEDRRALFVCCLVLMMDEYRMYCVQETVEGEIAHEPRGEEGFGYDPVFMVGGRSVAAMDAAEKDAISHRGRALRALGKVLDGVLEV